MSDKKKIPSEGGIVLQGGYWDSYWYRVNYIKDGAEAVIFTRAYCRVHEKMIDDFMRLNKVNCYEKHYTNGAEIEDYRRRGTLFRDLTKYEEAYTTL